MGEYSEGGTIWRSPPWLYPCLLLASAFCLGFRALISSKSHPPPHHRLSLEAFQRRFLYAFFLAQAADVLQNVFSESLYRSYGLQRKDMVLLLLVGHASAVLLGTLVAISADFLGRKKICCAYAVFLTLESVFKQWGNIYALCFARFWNGLAASVLYCGFETWMISEHEKSGFRSDWLCDTFWIMSFGGAIVSLGATAAGNFFVSDLGFSLQTPSLVAALLALLCGLIISTIWKENAGDDQLRSSTLVLLQTFLRDKRLVTLGFAQASFDISVSVFWLLWIPTIVADGREIHAGSIYGVLIASVMLGSSLASVAMMVSSSPERLLPPVFAIASVCLMVPAYDYQEIAVLVASFNVFHLCVGFSAPLLARSRSLYIGNGHRAGVYAVFHVPAKISLMIFLIEGSRLQVLDNSSILYICGFTTLAAAFALHLLNTWKRSIAAKV